MCGAGPVSMSIGDVPRIELHVHQNQDCTFEFQWWEDEAQETPIALASAEGQVREDHTEDEVILNLTEYVDIAGNVAVVRVPAAVTLALPQLDKGVWDFVLEAETGERRKVARGAAYIHRAVTR